MPGGSTHRWDQAEGSRDCSPPWCWKVGHTGMRLCPVEGGHPGTLHHCSVGTVGDHAFELSDFRTVVSCQEKSQVEVSCQERWEIKEGDQMDRSLLNSDRASW